MQPGNIPSGTFWIGAFCGLLLGVPLLTLAIAAGERGVALDTILSHAAIFAGFPALITTGGVARLIAARLAQRDRPPTIGAALAIGLPVMALAGAGLGMLVLVPLGPPTPGTWGPMLAGAAAAGLATGAALAVLVGVRQRRHTKRDP
jgi:hypothetical protein